MSSFGESRGQLISSPLSGDDRLLAVTVISCSAQRCAAIIAEAVVDWITLLAGMAASCLAFQHFLVGAAWRRSPATIVEVALCVASLTTFLLVNDGAYRGSHGPLWIRWAEHLIRAGIQASMLLVLVRIVLGGALSLVTIECSLCTAILLLIVTKQAWLHATAIPATDQIGKAQGADRWNDEVPTLAQSLRGTIQDPWRTVADNETVSIGRGYELPKKIVDFVFAILALIWISPVWFVTAILIRIDSPGPVIFRQQRVGKNGRLFTMYKFRTMDADAPQYAISPDDPKDPRITRVGRLLRKCSLDELPQLLNVIKGQMSLVGPRPEMLFLVDEHRAAHLPRLRVLPGMTGLWQLSPARSARIHDNLHYDHFYIQHRSFSMDLAILLFTPVRLMRGI